MDTIRVGRQLRALRHRRGWRQQDLAVRARVSQSTIARLEAGQLDGTSLRALTAIATALGVRLDVRLMGGVELDRLLDAGHAAIVEQVVRRLTEWRWLVETEVTFSIYGERGSIDVLAWHPSTCVVLVIEVKTAIGDVQAMTSTLDRKARLAARLAAARGWRVAAVARVVVLDENRTSRRIVSAHGATFNAAFAARGRSVLAWLRRPTATALRGLVFLPVTHYPGRRPRKRIRIAASAAASRSAARPAAAATERSLT